jgi:hypothetical protein
MPRLITENNVNQLDLSVLPTDGAAAITTRAPILEGRLGAQGHRGNVTTRVHTLAPVASSGQRNLLATGLSVP